MAPPFDVRIVGSLPTDWWNICFTAGAVLIGALIGAGISWWVARQTARENRDAAKAAQRNAEITATLRLMTKIMDLINNAGGYHFQIERELAEAKKQTGRDMAPWQVMTPRIGKPFEIEITADDLLVFIKSKKFDYVTEVLHVAALYNSMIYGFAGYSERRERLGEHMTPDDMDGLLGGTALGKEQFLRVAPYLMPVIQLAQHLRQEAKEVYEAAERLTNDFRPVVQKYFDDPHFPYPGKKSRDST